MSLKQVLLIFGLASVVGSSAWAQAPQAPRPAQPAPTADPAKPVGPPEGKNYPSLPKISVGAPSSGASKETQHKEEVATSAAAAFIRDAGHDGLAEVDLAKLAQSHAGRADVRAYAETLAADHQKANEELAAIARRKSVNIPGDPTPTDKDAMTRLEGLTGPAFDDAYIAAMVQDHTRAVAAFTTATRNADPEVKAFAEKTLPTLKHHLEEAQKLAKAK